jgi:LysR family transcriptional regulator, low CO2-responsive transcriptional regulator
MHGEGIRPVRSPLQRVIDPLRLQLVLEVGRHGSITRAADACGISQPTASAHLRTLEVAAGQPLFVRKGRGTALTDAGRLVAEHGATVLSALESLHNELGAMSRAEAGTLRIAACAEFGNYVLPAVLSRFAAERERVDIEAHVAPSAEVARLVAGDKVDLGIAGATGAVVGVVAERLMRDELVGIKPPGMPALTPFALSRMTLVLAPAGSSTRAQTEALFARLGRPARLVEVGSVEAVKRAVASGIGVAFVSLLAAADELERGELEAFGLRDTGPLDRWLHVLRMPHRTPPPLVRAFERTLRAVCAPAIQTADSSHSELPLPSAARP